MPIELRSLTGGQIVEAMNALAQLRIRVFAEWPYIYDGDIEYEREYLQEFISASGSILVAAIDGDEIVGAATASPMSMQKAEFRAPFEQRGIDTGRLFYFGESVLLPSYRGQGIGNRFFDHREAQARAWGAEFCLFAAVVRPDDHALKPADYRPLDKFWRKRGYVPMQGLITELSWKDQGEAEDTAKPMQYWMRQL